MINRFKCRRQGALWRQTPNFHVVSFAKGLHINLCGFPAVVYDEYKTYCSKKWHIFASGTQNDWYLSVQLKDKQNSRKYAPKSIYKSIQDFIYK